MAEGTSPSTSAGLKEPSRTHCAIAPDPIVLREVDQVPTESVGVHEKPRGFWYEVDGDWRRWCEGEQWGLDAIKYLHAVDLGDCNVLTIRTAEALDRFHRRYCGEPALPGHPTYRGINWSRVAAIYDGLEIAPYLWSRRLSNEAPWYYGWDCASGVIWRPRGATVTLVGPVPAMGEEAVV